MIRVESIRIEEFRGIRDLTLDINGRSYAVCGLASPGPMSPTRSSSAPSTLRSTRTPGQPCTAPSVSRSMHRQPARSR